MMTLVIPNLASMLSEVGQDIPIYTRVVIGISNFLVRYILLVLILVVAAVIFMYRFSRTEGGEEMLSRARMQVPAIDSIYKKLFLSRITDNLSTMLKSSLQVLRGLEITG